jgi:hypothetical protein
MHLSQKYQYILLYTEVAERSPWVLALMVPLFCILLQSHITGDAITPNIFVKRMAR